MLASFFAIATLLSAVQADYGVDSSPFVIKNLIPAVVGNRSLHLTSVTTSGGGLHHGARAVFAIQDRGFKFDVNTESFVVDTDTSTKDFFWMYLTEGFSTPVRGFVSDGIPTLHSFTSNLLVMSGRTISIIREASGFRDSPAKLVTLNVHHMEGSFTVDLKSQCGLSCSAFRDLDIEPSMVTVQPGVHNRTKMVAVTPADARCVPISGGESIPPAASPKAIPAAILDPRAPRVAGGRLALITAVERLVRREGVNGTPSEWISMTHVGGEVVNTHEGESQPQASAEVSESGVNMLSGEGSGAAGMDVGDRRDEVERQFRIVDGTGGVPVVVQCLFGFVPTSAPPGGAGGGGRSSSAGRAAETEGFHSSSSLSSPIAYSASLSETAGDTGVTQGALAVAYAFPTDPPSAELFVASLLQSGEWVWEAVVVGRGRVGIVDVGARRSLFTTSALAEYEEGEFQMPPSRPLAPASTLPPPSLPSRPSVAATAGARQAEPVTSSRNTSLRTISPHTVSTTPTITLRTQPVPSLWYSFTVSKDDVGKKLVLRWGGPNVSTATSVGLRGGVGVGVGGQEDDHVADRDEVGRAGVLEYTLHDIGTADVARVQAGLQLTSSLRGVTSGWVYGGQDYSSSAEYISTTSGGRTSNPLSSPFPSSSASSSSSSSSPIVSDAGAAVPPSTTTATTTVAARGGTRSVRRGRVAELASSRILTTSMFPIYVPRCGEVIYLGGCEGDDWADGLSLQGLCGFSGNMSVGWTYTRYSGALVDWTHSAGRVGEDGAVDLLLRGPKSGSVDISFPGVGPFSLDAGVYVFAVGTDPRPVVVTPLTHEPFFFAFRVFGVATAVFTLLGSAVVVLASKKKWEKAPVEKLVECKENSIEPASV